MSEKLPWKKEKKRRFVEMDRIEKRVKEITKALNKKIDEANKKPELMRGRKESREFYWPIRRTNNFRSEKYDVWQVPSVPGPHFLYDEFYKWCGVFELGLSTSSNGFEIIYLPIPSKYFEEHLGHRYWENKKAELLNLNPQLDLDKDVFSYLGPGLGNLVRKLASNNFQDMIKELDDVINLIEDSRPKE